MKLKKKKEKLVLDGGSFSLKEAEAASLGAAIAIRPEAEKRISSSWNTVIKLSRESRPVYGVTTGFGYLANKKISPSDQKTLQVNLLKSHAAGYGSPLSIAETRLAMALRLNILLKGYSGVRFSLCQALCGLINKGVYPCIPEYGSVGASGDLAPLAHLALPLIGEGFVQYRDKLMPASQALSKAKLRPFLLEKKEGIALINGTQVMMAVGVLAFIQAKKLIELADRIAALTFEGLAGRPEALFPEIHQARGHRGQMEVAEAILSELKGSYLFSKGTKRERVQDPYSMRCAPQIHGPARDAYRFVESILEKELNAATDNPLVFSDEDKILSGGNFHGQYLALAFDTAAIALAELGSVSERRLELLLNPHLSGLPAFLTQKEGINSGYMAGQYLSASVVNENKILANPSCTDSIPGNVGIEDHVSMGMTSARKFRKLVDNMYTIFAVELIGAAQAVDLRGVSNKLGEGTRELYRLIRAKVPKLRDDRIISEDIHASVEVLKNYICKVTEV